MPLIRTIREFRILVCLPLESRVVRDLLETVAVPSDNMVYFDNDFSCYIDCLRC